MTLITANGKDRRITIAKNNLKGMICVLKKLPSSLLFLSAAVYLTAQSNFDVITVFAVLICALCSAIALTHRSIWALIGGTGLISVSLAMQAGIKTTCLTCLKADLLILSAVICLSLVQRGKNKTPARVMALAMTIIMVAVSFIAVPISSMNTSTAAQGITTKLNPNKPDAEIEKLAETKPVLLFSPSCPACEDVTDALAKIDPQGEKWQPVQSSGEAQEGVKYLKEKGYTGNIVYHHYAGGVPALMVKQDGKIKTIYGKEKIIKAVSTPAK
ncbi:hypothetical protein SAMN02745133_02229 [Desulforamulus putei DSM 12395]|uniref:Thioredoxin domain-containing protein n=1 Tax=Desulforamulus putei DSM 12395 TaxID=1121429 RepID=A0A1M5A9L5_9FIRM|nr:hypothetical protein [Desulforamulus putei]SHF26978.1 hypothetical protein SAMN02745133_02229 [Desulforamulus putei DSM 12395]